MIRPLKKYSLEIVLLLPMLAYLLGFTLLPVMNSIYLSLFDSSGLAFPSSGSYGYIISHFQFKEALINTLVIVFAGLTLEFFLGLAMALVLLEKFRGRGLVRAVMLLPLGITTIVAASNMRYVFDTHGFLNKALMRLNIISAPADWTGGGAATLLSVIAADMWKVTPLIMLILLAGIESIPSEVIGAAKVDGASYMKRLRHIILPMLKPFITMALVVRGIDAFRIFELPLALAGRTVPVLSTYAFFEYREYGNVHTSAAASTMLFVIILVSIGAYLFLSRRNREI